MHIQEVWRYILGSATIYAIVAACAADNGSPAGANPNGFADHLVSPVPDALAQASSCQQWTVRIGGPGDQPAGEEPFAVVNEVTPQGPIISHVFTRRCLR